MDIQQQQNNNTNRRKQNIAGETDALFHEIA